MALRRTSNLKKSKGQRVKGRDANFLSLHPKTYTLNPFQKGFTLIELLVVIVIFSILATLGLFLSMDFYRTYSSNAEVGTLVSSLAKARAQSLANINEKEHGVHVQDNKYIVFARTAGAGFGSQISEDLEIPAGSGTSVTTTDIIFERLTGKARDGSGVCPCTINLSSQGKTKTVTINIEGGIDW